MPDATERRPFRFYDNREKYLLFTTTCSEKQETARRVGQELEQLDVPRALARELAPHGILVNGVSPGLVDTGFDPLSEEAKAAHAASLPLASAATTVKTCSPSAASGRGSVVKNSPVSVAAWPLTVTATAPLT